MIQYRFAHNKNQQVVDILELPSGHAESLFRCIGCGSLLAAKTRGEKKARHFSHRAGSSCSEETYLHRLAKETFHSVYQECLRSGDPFTVQLQHPRVCSRYEALLGEACYLGPTLLTHNLTRYYNNIQLESRDGAFIPDLLIFHGANPSTKIYIEMAVTHSLSKTKSESGNRMIEIPIRSESDIDKIRSRNLPEGEAAFLNFPRRPVPVPPEGCACPSRQFYALFIYKSGKTYLGSATMHELEIHLRSSVGSIVYRRFVDAGRFIPSPPLLFQELIQEASEQGVSVKSCFVCRHSAIRTNGPIEYPLYCRWFETCCNSNRAAACQAFQVEQMPSDGKVHPPQSSLPTGGPPDPQTPDPGAQLPAQVDLSIIQEQWSLLLEQLALDSRRLRSLFLGSRPVEYVEGVLTVEFEQWYQQEQVLELPTRRKAEKILARVFGQPLYLSASLYIPGKP